MAFPPVFAATQQGHHGTPIQRDLQAGAHLHHTEPQGGVQRLREGQTHHAFLDFFGREWPKFLGIMCGTTIII